MNYTICDSSALENDLSLANGDRRTGVVTMAMIQSSLSLFESQEVITVIGSTDFTRNPVEQLVTVVVLIEETGVVVGEASVMTVEQASRLRPLHKDTVEAYYPDLVYHLCEVLFYLGPPSTQLKDRIDAPDKAAHILENGGERAITPVDIRAC